MVNSSRLSERFTCAGFVLDPGTRQLTRAGGAVHLSPRAFDLLALLVARRPEVVAKAELFDALWPDTHVTDTSLANLVAEVRAILGESAQDHGHIRTVHRRGYAFQDPSAISDGPVVLPSPPGYWVVTPSGQVPLRPGDNLVGRDPAARIWIDAPSVSRQHARIRVEGGRALVEDLGSKNGTRARSQPVLGATEVADGDVIHFGSVAVTLRAWPAEATRTEGDVR